MKLRERIIQEIAIVTPQILKNVLRDIEYRLDILQETNGVHVELLWGPVMF